MTTSEQVAADFQKAVGLLNGGKLAEAEQILTPIAAAYPDHGMVRFVLGMALGGLGRTLEALAALRKAAALGVDQPNLLPTIAGLLVNAGWTEEGIARYREALKKGPADAKLVIQLATALMIHGELGEALALFRKVREADSNNIAAIGNAAQILATLGHDDEAMKLMALGAQLQPQAEFFRNWTLDLGLLKALRTWISGQVTPVLRPADESDAYVPLIQNALPASAQPSVVYFHVAQGAPHPIQSLQDGQSIDYFGILRLSAQTARRVLPGARTVLLTDTDTALPDGLGVDVAVRLPLQRSWIMYERMRSQRALVASGRAAGPVLFLDTDIIPRRDFTAVFAQVFDVGLTWRVHPLMPLNGGMILGKNGASPGLLRFFDICLGAYDALAELPTVRERYPFSIKEFQGDQLALAAFTRWHPFIGRPARATIDGVEAAFFPADDLNASFSPALDPAALDGKFAVHFKGGKAKSFAAAFAARVSA